MNKILRYFFLYSVSLTAIVIGEALIYFGTYSLIVNLVSLKKNYL